MDLLQEFCQEALVWRQLRHPNVLPFLGISKELFTPRYCLISPWMVNGDVMSYLEAHPDHDRLTSVCQTFMRELLRAEEIFFLAGSSCRRDKIFTQSQSSDSTCGHTRGAFILVHLCRSLT